MDDNNIIHSIIEYIRNVSRPWIAEGPAISVSLPSNSMACSVNLTPTHSLPLCLSPSPSHPPPRNSSTETLLSVLLPSLFHTLPPSPPTGRWAVAFKEAVENQGCSPLWFPQVLLICCEGAFEGGVLFFKQELQSDVCVWCVFWRFWSLWKLGRPLLQSIWPYIWANLEIKCKYSSSQRTRLPKGLLFVFHLLILNFRIIKLVPVQYLNFT